MKNDLEHSSSISTFQKVKDAWSIKRNLSTIFIRKNDRWAFLDGYRAIGIFWVILGHTVITTQGHFGMKEWSRLVADAPFYLQWVFNGDIAVDGFLMVSGFLMANILIKSYQEHQTLNIKVFYLSRFLRLSPAYFFALIIVALYTGAVGKDVWPNFFYIQNFFNDYDRYFLSYTWSLAVEEQFYLLLPAYLFFVLLKTKHPFSHIILAIIVSLIIRAWVVLDDDILRNSSIKDIIFTKEKGDHFFVVLYDNLYTRFGAFLPGIAIAYAYRFKADTSIMLLKSNISTVLTILSMTVLLVLFTLPVLMDGVEFPQWFILGLTIAKRNVICICCAWLLFCGLFNSNNAKRFNTFMSSKFFYPFGHLLYSMYLFHFLAVGFVLGNMKYNFRIYDIDVMQHLEAWVFLAAGASIFLATIIATITYLLIEAPILNLRPKMSG